MNPLLKIGFEASPTLLLKKYRRAINHEASVTCTALTPGGLKEYGITMTDPEWADLSLPRATSDTSKCYTSSDCGY